MDKYTGLPDIEEGPQQVFESSDVEDEPIALQEDAQSYADSDVDESSTDIVDAKKKFKHDFVTGEWDFSGNVGNPLSSSGYKVVSLNETVDEKLARITRELEEIKIASESEAIESDKNNEIEFLVGLVERLSDKNKTNEDSNEYTKAIETISPYSKRIKEVFELTSEQLSFKSSLVSNPATTGYVNPSAVLALEARIHDLETVLGSSEEGTRQSVQGQITELERKANLVYNPEYHTKKLSEEVEKLNANVERYLANRRLAQIGGRSVQGGSVVDQGQGGAEARNNKIDEVFSRIPDFDNVKAILPAVLARLKSLHLVHNELGACVRTVTELDKTLGGIETEMVKWNKSVNDVNEKLDKQELDFDRNKQIIEQWVKQLEERVGKK
ncbi:nuclear migration protein Jnm1p [[Candida] railenensis]|uniref:Nuclear migration protein Jnm1p n=1 Tax=[Candida] railenensis TaxID=45579 RepID=A0A9P0QS35_9ASCO|nr:nuclear migration protein Jnm1p [[Candida] railenensis]